MSVAVAAYIVAYVAIKRMEATAPLIVRRDFGGLLAALPFIRLGGKAKSYDALNMLIAYI